MLAKHPDEAPGRGVMLKIGRLYFDIPDTKAGLHLRRGLLQLERPRRLVLRHNGPAIGPAGRPVPRTRSALIWLICTLEKSRSTTALSSNALSFAAVTISP